MMFEEKSGYSFDEEADREVFCTGCGDPCVPKVFHCDDPEGDLYERVGSDCCEVDMEDLDGEPIFLTVAEFEERYGDE